VKIVIAVFIFLTRRLVPRPTENIADCPFARREAELAAAAEAARSELRHHAITIEAYAVGQDGRQARSPLCSLFPAISLPATWQGKIFPC
jgi:hypothetical protein